MPSETEASYWKRIRKQDHDVFLRYCQEVIHGMLSKSKKELNDNTSNS